MKRYLTLLIIVVLSIEFIGIILGTLKIEPTGFRFHLNLEPFDRKMPYADIDSLVGVWHEPSDSWVHSGPCFTAAKSSNRWGAGDNDWDTTKAGYVFAGSSFVEGYGIEYGNRFTEHFEKLSGKEVFNLGMAGTFSPVQYFMSIKKFENILHFDTCFVFIILPSDEKLLTEIDKKRYRPYWIDNQIVYQKNTSFQSKKSGLVTLQNAVQQYSYIYHLITFYNNRNSLKASLLVSNKTNADNSFTELKKINKLFCESYPNKFFYFVLLPTLGSREKQQFCFDKMYSNSKLLDLRGSLNYRTDFFICNPHWNEKGHKNFAGKLFEEIKKANSIL